MSKTLCAVLAAGAFLTAASAQAETSSESRAMSAESYATQASFRTTVQPQREQGYSPSTRRIADCLATYPGYDPRIDRVRMRDGATRACRL